MSNVLHQICEDKKDHIADKKLAFPLSDLETMLQNQTPIRGFIHALQKKSAHGTALISEVKKASPSKGVIRHDFDPVQIAQTYEQNGAACLSVLTDEPYFQGHDDYFTAVRKAVELPMLRKDFMIDPYQIYESRNLGADCILLIMACLSDDQARELYHLTTSLGMDTLFEVHDEKELERALDLKPHIVGVNNRDLKTLDVDLQTGLDMAEKIPTNILKVAESGIYNHTDIQKFSEAGYSAFLVGESLMREDDIGAAVQKLLRGE